MCFFCSPCSDHYMLTPVEKLPATAQTSLSMLLCFQAFEFVGQLIDRRKGILEDSIGTGAGQFSCFN